MFVELEFAQPGVALGVRSDPNKRLLVDVSHFNVLFNFKSRKLDPGRRGF
jgi:hypothetical protein